MTRWARTIRASALGFALLLIAACTQAPLPAEPAIWHVTGNGAQEAWLFGTIHAAPAPLAWHSAAIDTALSRSREVMVEVANIADDAAVARAFAALSHSPGLPPVEQRVAPAQRQALLAMLAARGIKPDDLRDVETWAVALTLARPTSGSDPGNGVDRAVLAAAAGKPVVELEGASHQLAIFDRLPEADQRDLLGFVLADARAMDDDADLVDVWRKGDISRIDAETRTGLLGAPRLREALLTARNRRWTARIGQEMRAGRRPFVAVGAAHMTGRDGLVAMLQHAGYKVTRLQ